MKNSQEQQNKGEIIIYKTKEEKTSLEVKLREETVWLTQFQITKLFGVNIPAVSKHIKNIFQEKELSKKVTVSKMETFQFE